MWFGEWWGTNYYYEIWSFWGISTSVLWKGKYPLRQFLGFHVYFDLGFLFVFDFRNRELYLISCVFWASFFPAFFLGGRFWFFSFPFFGCWENSGLGNWNGKEIFFFKYTVTQIVSFIRLKQFDQVFSWDMSIEISKFEICLKFEAFRLDLAQSGIGLTSVLLRAM